MSNDEESSDKIRIDKWLWAARFYKTRSQAREAIDGGKVYIDGVRAKPSRAVCVGQTIQMTIHHTPFTVLVTGLSDIRRGAPEARELYQETEESKQKREERKLLFKYAAEVAPAERPNSQMRRQLRRLKGKE